MDEIDAMFTDLLGEMDNLSQSLTSAAREETPSTRGERTISIGFKDLNESLNELEDQDLDALVADLGSKEPPSQPGRPPTEEQQDRRPAPPALDSAAVVAAVRPPPPPPHAAESPPGPQTGEAQQTKADKIRLALEKLKEAKVRKLIVKVFMSDNSSRTLMVDETQTVREVLDKMFEKTHCDADIAWTLCERNPELQTERGFEDHECLVETLSTWTRHSDNTLYFVSRPQRYTMFTHPQLFYLSKKKMDRSSEISQQAKDLLIKEHFGGGALIVPDVEGTLHLKEDGKKVWKPRYFVLRASGIYYVPKGKTKMSSDLACFVRFENVDIYTTRNYKHKYRAPSNFCFILKHPCIQKESHYIKFLCCENEEALLLWLTSIRIAKYGTVLYKNYQTATKRASLWQTLLPAACKNDSLNSGDLVGPKSAQPPPPSTAEVQEYPYEPPPDFIPPPPPGHAGV